MQVAAQVGSLNEPGQRVAGGGFNLAQVLAQFGRNPVHAQGGVDILFGGGGNCRVVVKTGQRPLAERVAHLECALAKGHVVRLGAGEVLQGGPVGGRGQQAHIHLKAVGEMEAYLVLAFGDDVVDAGIGGYVLDCCGGMFRGAGRAGDQQVEVARSFAATAQGAGGRHLLNSREGQQVG